MNSLKNSGLSKHELFGIILMDSSRKCPMENENDIEYVL